MYDEIDQGFYEAAVSYRAGPASDGAERLARLRLIRSRRVGPATYRRLMAEHGSARAALTALPDVARAAGVNTYSPCPEGVALAEIKAAKRCGAKMLSMGDPDYPMALQDLGDAPPILWALGDTDLMARPVIAMVGTRNASSLGARMATRLATDLSKAGFVMGSIYLTSHDDCLTFG